MECDSDHGDAQPATKVGDDDDDDGTDSDADEQSSEEGSQGDTHPTAGGVAGEPEYTVQATDCRVTSTRHDDWLHRGPFLADVPWHV